MKFVVLLFISFSFSAFAYNSSTVGNRPERIDSPPENRVPASVSIKQEAKKDHKSSKK